MLNNLPNLSSGINHFKMSILHLSKVHFTLDECLTKITDDGSDFKPTLDKYQNYLELVCKYCH